MLIENKSAVGALFSVGASLASSVIGVAAKLSSATSPVLIGALGLGMSTLFMLFILVALKRMNPCSVIIAQRVGLKVFLTGALVAAVMSLYLGAYQMLAVGNAALILATAPVLTPFIAWFALGEKPSRRTALAIVLTVVGCALAARPAFLFGTDQQADAEQHVDSSLALLGWLCGVGGAFTLASLYTAMRLLKDESSLLVNLHLSWIGGLLLGVLATVSSEGWPGVVTALLDDSGPLTVAVIVGIFPNLLATVAASFANASVVAVAGQSEVVFAFVFQIFWFDHVPEWSSVLGACIVVSSVALVATEEGSSAANNVVSPEKDEQRT